MCHTTTEGTHNLMGEGEQALGGSREALEMPSYAMAWAPGPLSSSLCSLGSGPMWESEDPAVG